MSCWDISPLGDRCSRARAGLRLSYGLSWVSFMCGAFWEVIPLWLVIILTSTSCIHPPQSPRSSQAASSCFGVGLFGLCICSLVFNQDSRGSLCRFDFSLCAASFLKYSVLQISVTSSALNFYLSSTEQYCFSLIGLYLPALWFGKWPKSKFGVNAELTLNISYL